MKKFLKYASIILGVLIIIAIVVLALLVTFVNPNRFKPLITEQVKKYTGRDLVMDGDLSWTLFPYLGVKIGHLELSNPPEFKQKVFAEIQGAMIGVKLLPLLHSQIESSGMSLKGLKLNLIKNVNGKTNWQDLSQSSSASAATVTTESPVPNTKKSTMKFSISAIDITNATISWIDEKSKQTLDIEKFDMQAKNISLTKPFPFTTAFDFVGHNPSLSGHVAVTSKMAINLEKEIYLIDDLDLIAKVNKDKKNINFEIKGNVAADMARQKLQLDNLVANLANLRLSGKANVTDFPSKPQVIGHVHIHPFDVKNWLQTIGQDVSTLQTLKNLSGDFEFTAGTSLSSVDLKGSAKLDEVQTAKVKMTSINVQTQMQKGTLTLSPLTAQFYQGALEGLAKVNLTTAVPQMTLQAKLTNMQAEPLLTDLAPTQKLKLSGTGNIDLQITTAGTSADVITKNLNGTARLSFSNGTVKGIDIGYLIDSAIALVNKQSTPGSNTEQTPFGSLTASATIHNGVISNQDLYLNSPRFDSKGAGTIDLVAKQIKYELQTTIKQPGGESKKNNLANLYGYMIPINITGSLDNPSIRMDMQGLMKSVAQEQLQKAKSQVQEKIQERIKKEIPGKAGELLNNLLGQ